MPSPRSSNPATVATPYADLARVGELWLLLPPTNRAAILTLANASGPAPTAGPSGGPTDEHRERLPPVPRRVDGRRESLAEVGAASSGKRSAVRPSRCRTATDPTGGGSGGGQR